MKRSLFLSHTSSDKDQAREIYHALTGHGIEVWFDEAEIPWGGGLWEHIARGAPEPERLSELLRWRSPSSRAETCSLSGDGWRAISLGEARPRAPRGREVTFGAGLKVSGTIQVQDPPVHALVSRHHPPVTWIFQGPDDTQPEVVLSVLSPQDLRLRDKQHLRWPASRRGEHYPEIDLATLDDLGRLTGLDH
jgi:hypothetical protein